MNLATRCTACGTLFRVVQDQLKVSDGWVRCGRCQTVFNAQESLFDLEHDTPPPWQAPAEMPDAGPVAELVDDDLAANGACEMPAPPTQDARPQAWTALEPPMPASATEPWPPDSAPIEAVATESVLAAPDEADPAPTAAETVGATALDDTAPEVTPGFLRQAQRDERWQQPPVRRMLWALTAMSALLLGVQVIHYFRQVIATQHPGAVPWLQDFCAVARCRIDTLQRIADVSIESTALSQSQGPAPATAPASAPTSAEAPDDAASAPDSDAHLLRLALTLRNRGEWAIAMPSVDLSLTGSDGELVARRSLSPVDFGVGVGGGDPRLLPGLDTPLSLRFRVAGGRVSGYTVEVFYP